MGTEWADVSQYQGISVDDRYPHPVLSFRTNSGDRVDRLAVENARRAKELLDAGRLRVVIAYYFFWPGQANCDLHRELLEQAGLWGHPRLMSMIDVEGAPLNGDKRIRDDQSDEVNDEAARLAGWYGNRCRVIGYWNPVADPELWPHRPPWLRLVVPSYGRPPGQPLQTPPGFFAHQYTSTGRCAPWPDDVDLNHTDLDLPELLTQFGIHEEEGEIVVSDPVTEGAAQLHPFDGKLRPIAHPDNVNASTRSPAQPWPYDMWADVWNETVWDGFTLPTTGSGDAEAERRSLVGWVLDTAARVRGLEGKLDRVLEGEEGR
ncbi:hypothetical protein [Nocardia terpenica]|uniref:Lysin A, glycosyl hydrolase domain n=1 Tax=Nocardia terpenica TaxID=455432 RepID=A0A164HBI9_9NOCA|nr:hypothetical protein [Nocardia terpenica]KZM68367.1 hypothetical protein AWN90_10800 [Nocardia terpenica]NQE88717.1 hypothetical protein [Nocardia terpenica]